MAMSDTQRQLLCMALALEGDALPKTDVCMKSPEASEKPLQLGAVTISILYKINFAPLGKPGTAQFPTGQGNSYSFYYLCPLPLALLILYKLTLLAQSNDDRLSTLPGLVPAQPVLPQMAQKYNKSPAVLQLIHQV